MWGRDFRADTFLHMLDLRYILIHMHSKGPNSRREYGKKEYLCTLQQHCGGHVEELNGTQYLLMTSGLLPTFVVTALG